MKKITKFFNITITVIISFIAVFGVASATGIFYYNDVRNQIVFNANISLTGTSLSKFMVNTINSDRNPLTISGLQDLQFRFGKFLPTSSFGLNNNTNDRVFQIQNDGTLMIGTALNNATTVSAANAKFSVDTSGNLLVRGSTRFTGGLIADGNIINSSGWNEILRFNGDTGLIAGPGSLGFTMDKTNGFKYGTGSATITRGGDLLAINKITTPKLCLGTPGNVICKTLWLGDGDANAVVDTAGLATNATVKTTVDAATKSFGGMYSFYIMWPQSSVGATNFTPIPFDSGYAYDSNGNPTAARETGVMKAGTFNCKTGTPTTGKCTCPGGYLNKRLFYRDFRKDNEPSFCNYTFGDTSWYCKRIYFFACTK